MLKETYHINNLNRHEIYKTNSVMNIDFFFNDTATIKDISNSRGFIIRVFILKFQSNYGGTVPYQKFLNTAAQWESVNCRFFIGNRKFIEEKYKSDQVVDYFENMDISLNSRVVNTNQLQSYKKLLQNKSKAINDVIFEKTFKGGLLAVKIKSKDKLMENDINNIKTFIETIMAPELKEEGIYELGMNMDYLGILLQLYSYGEKYSEELYLNGEKTSWSNESWMNFKFYDNKIVSMP